MKYKVVLVFFTSMVIVATTGKWCNAQVDPHFSQYYMYPMGLNPALTGAMDGDYRLSAIYRSQWGGIADAYVTMGVSADMSTSRHLSIGVHVMNQKAGDGYNYLNGHVALAYTGVKMGERGNHRLIFGLQGGLLSRRFDPSKLTFNSQWTPGIGYNPGLPSGERFDMTVSNVFDAGFGVAYFDTDPDKQVTLFGGIAAFHLTQPNDPFLIGSDKSVLPIRYALHAGARIVMSETIQFVPNGIYLRQGNAEEKMLGAYFQVMVNDNTDLMLGGNWRTDDALVPFAGFYLGGVTLGLSYDANISRLRSLSASNANSFELSLSFTGRKKNRLRADYFKCPRF